MLFQIFASVTLSVIKHRLDILYTAWCWSRINLFKSIPLFRCPNLAVKEAEDDENIEEEDVPVEKPKKVPHAKRKKQTQCKLTWIGESIHVCVFILCGR